MKNNKGRTIMNKPFLTLAAVVAGASPAVSNAAIELHEQAKTYTVKTGDSLFKIAKHIKRTRHPERSINETMQALYQANPQAFTGSADRLQSNVVLAIPDFAGVPVSGMVKPQQVKTVSETAASDWRVLTPGAGIAGAKGPVEAQASTTAAALVQENTRLKASLRQKNRLIAVLDNKLDQSRAALMKQAEAAQLQTLSHAVQPVVMPAANATDPRLLGFVSSGMLWFISANALLLLLVFWLVYRLWRQHRALQTMTAAQRQQMISVSTASSTSGKKREPVSKRLLRQTTSGYYEMLSFARPALSYFGMDLRAGYDAMFQVSQTDTVSAYRGTMKAA